MLHIIAPYLFNVFLLMSWLYMLRENKRLRDGNRYTTATGMTVSDFQVVYNWIKSGMPERVAETTPPGFALDAMRLVWFAVKGEKK
jgi:hypothetical protein